MRKVLRVYKHLAFVCDCGCYFTSNMMQRHKSTFETMATEYLCTVFWIKLEHRPSTPFLFKYKFIIINKSKEAKE